MKRSILLSCLIGLTVSLFMTVLSNFDEHSTPARYNYSGKVLLNDSEYSKLKYQLAQPEVTISILDVLSSDEHLVRFSVSVPANIPFDYGEITHTSWRHTPLWDWSIAVVSLSIAIMLGIIVSYTEE